MSAIPAPAPVRPAQPRQRVHWTDRVAHLLLAAIAAALAAFLAGPLSSILAQSVEGKQGEFVALDNFFAYFATQTLFQRESASAGVPK